LGFGFAFGFGRTITSTCSWGIGTITPADVEREAFPSSAIAGSIAIDGAARDAITKSAKGWARKIRGVCIF
jgi:hypothetical protein